jgi:hypothetical protein
MALRTLAGCLTGFMVCVAAQAQPNSPSEWTTIAYPVADLVVPVNMPQIVGKGKLPTNEAELMDYIPKKVSPASWDRAGGQGTMRYEASGYLLHVRQSAAVHAELKAFLEKLLRREVAIELRIMSLSEKVLENRGLKWSESDRLQHVLLDDAGLYQLLIAAQGDVNTHIMQAPKLTLMEGQDADINVYDWMVFQTGADVEWKDGVRNIVAKNEKHYVGVKSRFLPTISSDRKHVTLQAEIVVKNLLSEPAVMTMALPVGFDASGQPKDFVKATVQKPSFTEVKVALKAKIPDQRTLAIVAGKVLVDQRNVSGPQFLSKIPYISRLYRNQAFSRDVTTVVFALSPRIVAEPETVQVERLRGGIQASDDGLFPLILPREER